MKKCYLPIALVSLLTVSFATNVTFRLNMSTYSAGATDSTSTIHVRGSFNGWTDADSLTNDGGDYWSTTIDITAGDSLEYKYTHTDDLGALTWESIDNREFVVPSADTVMDLAYFNNVAPYIPTDSLDVFFRVNMAGVTAYAGEQVDVRGSFNGWAAGDDLTKDTVNTDFWSGVVSLPTSEKDSTIEYKFTYYDGGTTTWESIDNRKATIHQDTTLAWKWFNNEPYSAIVDTFKVTFTLNTSTLDNFTDSTRIGFVTGDYDNWDHFNDTLETVGDYSSRTIEIIASGGTKDIKYKFLYKDPIEQVTWESVADREVTIKSDTSFFHYWDDIAPFTATDSLDVWFRVHVGSVLDDIDFVDVRGSFNGWSAGDTLTMEGATDYWSGLVSLPDTGATAIEYKFTYTDPDGAVHWEDNISNRMATIRQDTTLAFKYFDDTPPPEVEPVTASVYWTVDMTAYEMMGLFSPARDDTMQVRGGFNGWASTAAPDGSDLIATNVPGTAIYELSVPLTMFPGSEDKYKYYICPSEQSRDIILSENPYMVPDMGYENPPTMGGGDRPYTFEGIEGQTQVIGLEYYNDIPLEGLVPLGHTIDLTSSVDMSPATTLGFDASTDTVWFIFQDHWAEHIQGFSIAENSHHPDLVLSDPDGDMVYSVTFTVTGYTPGSAVYTYEFGNITDGYFQEGGGFAYGRYRCRYIQKGKFEAWPTEYDFPQDTWTSDPPLTVEDSPAWVAVEEVANLPTEFTVSQNYPNPFNPVTEIKFTLPEADLITFTVYNVLGQEVLTYKRNFNGPGTYGLKWNGSDNRGVPVASGIYLYRLETSKQSVTKKMMLLR